MAEQPITRTLSVPSCGRAAALKLLERAKRKEAAASKTGKSQGVTKATKK